jgi:TetR/AcrR family transcriptional regulator, cholesterol catabolism regulator
MASRPSKRRATRTTARPSAKRREQEVLDAALKVFHERGYEGASVEDIADVLGILKGSLYYYITSKEDLLFRIVSEVHEDVQKLMEEVAARPELSPLERLSFYIHKQVEYNARNVIRISVYYRDLHRLSDARLKDIRNRRKTQDRFIRSIIEEAQELGEVNPEINASLASHCVFGTIIWVHTWYNPRTSATATDVADVCVQYALKGLTGMRAAGDSGIKALSELAASG